MHFKITTTVALATLVAHVYGHGLVTAIIGANGVNMPGLGVIDGTPRDCTTPSCGAEADVPVFSNGGNPLGKSQKGGNINAADEVSTFMGTGTANTAVTANKDVKTSALQHVTSMKNAKKIVQKPMKGKNGMHRGKKNTHAKDSKQQSTHTTGNDASDVNDPGLQPETAAPINGGAPPGAVAGGQDAGAQVIDARANIPEQGSLVQGTKTQPGTKENAVKSSAGQGAKLGLPTADENGNIDLQFHQVNGDGAGPYEASIDPTSGGTQESAFQPAQMVTNVPGKNGIDAQNSASDFTITVKMPAGMTCTGTIAGQKNLCVVRIKNPRFGGSAVFQQTGATSTQTPNKRDKQMSDKSAASAKAASHMQTHKHKHNKDAHKTSKDAHKTSKDAHKTSKDAHKTSKDVSKVQDPNLHPEVGTPINGGAPPGAVAGGQDPNAQVIDARNFARFFVA